MARHAPAGPSGTPGRGTVTLAVRRPAGLRLGIGALVLLLLGGLVTAVVVSLLGALGESRRLPPAPTSTTETPAGAAVYVHILGEVGTPGVYVLRDGDRVIDAIAAAGGFTASADQHAVNLVRFVSDGEQILVPAQGAAPAPGVPPVTAGGKVNLNTATVTELDTLPRVGPVMAERILAWREEHGRFTSVDDLLGVPGIGDRTFEALRDLVTV